MPTYHVEAMDVSGNEVTDNIEAENERAARQLLAQRGLFVTNLCVATGVVGTNRIAESDLRSPPAPELRISLTPALKKRHVREKRVVGLGFVVIGTLSLAFGVWMAFDAIPFVISAKGADGLCVGQDYNPSDGEYNIPIIEFTADGRTHRVEARGILEMRSVNAYKKGHRMTVLYPPNRPEEARVGGRIRNLQFPIACIGLGGIFALSGIWLYWTNRKA